MGRRLVGPIEEVVGTVASTSSQDLSAPETSAACLLRHRGGIVSTLSLQSCGVLLSQPPAPLVISGAHGDVVVEDDNMRVNAAEAALGVERSKSSNASLGRTLDRSSTGLSRNGTREEALVGPDRIWELF